MVNAAGFRTWWPVFLGAAVLTAAAWLRGAEYDEQYTLFLTAGTPRPVWPDGVFPAGSIAAVQAGHATFLGIARDLRATDVHPPLYFWAAWLWRFAFGPGLLAVRMLSVLSGVGSLVMTGMLARRCQASPVAAMLVTLGCYGFVYTSAIARGFALAEVLTLAGVVLVMDRRPWLAGLCFGAACACNYLAVFVAAAVVLASAAWPAALTAAPLLALDGWFFLAQHGARNGQFPPFDVWRGVVRLAAYQVASVFGGLPLYVDGVARFIVGAVVAVGAVVLLVVMVRGAVSRIVWAAAAAPAIGLLVLGAVFDNTPIELRYLSFGLPFVGVLAAGLGVNSPGPASRVVGGGATPGHDTSDSRRRGTLLPVLALQILGIAGLLLAPGTGQPAREAATRAAGLAGGGIVLLPRGNDGVGIVGAFGIEAPPALPIQLIRPGDPPPAADRVVLVTMTQDRDSTAAVASMRAALAAANWRLAAIGYNLEVYERSAE